jgi:hypothetical protein
VFTDADLAKPEAPGEEEGRQAKRALADLEEQ